MKLFYCLIMLVFMDGNVFASCGYVSQFERDNYVRWLNERGYKNYEECMANEIDFNPCTCGFCVSCDSMIAGN